ncbi:Imm52 family immunity protein [Xanthomonas translucens]|jgi:hypothetical protein|uniref:Imm52 family immunity protein n=1 Tax=Xanthomonas campestris pv. translucens TaxID=343 RepID=UPI000ACF7A09|nr:Imm52 family immunity protein [Xanthomonas translucens]MCT8271647.1 immunity 52 family protein [Xanthomonas translucens pv. undulosa]MCT8283499.1 immunity 52 family protein [Xanthomonas translucens pv. undulosa]MCT8318849.1 immunity 52 family protein [Xanthomonas translucens pv. undulosa]UJB14786.1 immunity 52 family protein [Xanthomonas translucens pv. undulosa]UPU49880.1 immunity 52 family protein [Xanthomonas translucens pv. undulosa]
MISAALTITLAKQPTATAAEGYDRTQQLLIALHRKASALAPDLGGWFGGVVTPADEPFPFDERTRMIERLIVEMEASEVRMFSIFLDTAKGGKRKPNQLELHYVPQHGVLRISIYRPTDTRLVASLLSAVPDAIALEFGFVDVYDNDPAPEEPGDKAWYSSRFATFQHRQCLGWMAYVPKVVTKEQLPLAADILPANGGSIIVATQEPFDLSNKEHIKRANQIEMDMNDLGLLAVTDPTF